MKKKTVSIPIQYPDIPIAQLTVRLCLSFEVKHVVICAGSRNAPLTNGFLGHPNFKTYSIVDERAAAFFALGIAQQLKQAVALVCTSGSALLNFYPAVAEAFYSDIPLVILSADRMPHRIDIGDGQTIRQTGVFEPHLEAAAALKPDVIHATQTLLENPMQKLIPQAATQKQIEQIQSEIEAHNIKEMVRVLRTAQKQKGPVHLNIPMEEPLYGMTPKAISIPFKLENPPLKQSKKKVDELKKVWQKATKKWVLIGVLAPDAISPELFSKLCEDPSVVVFTETTSNREHPNAIHSIDTLMAPLELSDDIDQHNLKPEIVLTFGGMIVSKKIKQFLRKNKPQKHWHVDEKKAYNTYYCLEEHIKKAPDDFLSILYKNEVAVSSEFQADVRKIYTAYKNKGRSYLNKIPFSDLKVFDFIAQQLKGVWQLQIANSSPIRYTQLVDWKSGLQFFCNRGTSGIDGSTATAVGAAQVISTPTLLITGDLSFFYDINALWNNYIPPSFRIIMINNQGGGIFRILPGQKDTPSYDRYFETIHQRNAKHLAKAFGFTYTKATSMWGLKQKFSRFIRKSSTPKILEIQTPRKINDKVLLGYFKAML